MRSISAMSRRTIRTGSVPTTAGPGGPPEVAALGRYAERCESLVRVFRAVTSRLVEAASIADAPELSVLVRAMITLQLVPPEQQFDFLESKIQVPALRPGTVSRTALVNRLRVTTSVAVSTVVRSSTSSVAKSESAKANERRRPRTKRLKRIESRSSPTP